MPHDVAWKLVVDESGSIKRMELFDKAAEKTDRTMAKTKQSAKETESGLKSLGGAFSGLRSTMGMAFGALGIGGAAFGLQSIVSTTSSLADETEKFHSVTGMGAQSSLDYVAALKARGIGTEAVTRGYKALSKSIQTAERQQYGYAVSSEKARAKGHMYTGLLGVQAEAFHQLGISFATFKALKPEKQFQEITEKLEAMSRGIEKTRIAGQLFGRGGTALLPVLEKNSLSLNHFRREAERFFPTLGGEGVHTLDQLREKTAEGKMAWEGLEFTLGMELAPALTTVAAEFSHLIVDVEHGQGPLGELGHTLGGLVKDARSVGEALGLIHGKDKHSHKVHHKVHHTHGSSSDLTKALEGGGALGAAILGYRTLVHPFKTLKGLGRLVLGGTRGLGRIAFPGEGLFGSELLGGIAGGGAFALGGLIPPLSGMGIRAGTEALLGKGFFASGNEMERAALTGSTHALKRMGYPGTELTGTPAPETEHGRQLRELIAIRNAIIELHNKGESGHQIVGDMHLDSTKVGEIIALNPKAMRFLAEGVERSALGRRARR